MKNLLIVITLNLALSTLNCFCFAQNKNIDSLLSLLKTDKADTNKVIHSNNLCREYLNIGLYDTALHYGNNALLLAQQLNFKNGIAQTNNYIGTIYRLQADYPKALEYYLKALKLDLELKNKKGIATRLGNIGIVYKEQGDYPKALDYYFKALVIDEELGNKNGIARHLGNIGIVYVDQGDYPKALDYYFKALKMKETLKDKKEISTTLGNIGGVYGIQGDQPKALEYYFNSLKMAKELGDKQLQANILSNIGIAYDSQGDYPKALSNDFNSLKIAEELEDKNGIAIDLGNIGLLYIKTGKFKDAEQCINRAIGMDNSIGALDYLKQSEEALSHLYDTTGRLKEALIHYKKSIMIKDTIFSQENKKQLVRKELNYEFDKKEAATKAEQDKRDAVTAAEKQKQQFILLLVSCFLILVFVFAGFIFRSLRITRKQKQIIELQNANTEHQKKIIEEKHKEITDSINYAERIQRSFLASKEVLDANLSGNEDGWGYFVFFRPKDVVSGDFYWATTLANGNFALVTADSTGHGVPGAIMSILNISSLEKAVEQGLCTPSEIFGQTRKTIIERLKKDGSAEGGKDGMDASIICFERKKEKLLGDGHLSLGNQPITNELMTNDEPTNEQMTMTYSAANNPIWLVRENNLIELKPDKMPVGKHDKDQTPYTQTEFQLQKGDVVYTLTDGMPDQFGGPKGKKFMSKQLKEFLVSISHLPMDEQKEKLNEVFENWQGNYEQVDDVSLIGIRI